MGVIDQPGSCLGYKYMRVGHEVAKQRRARSNHL